MRLRRHSPLLTMLAWFAATATLSVWPGASDAHATCGDYLMLQDHGASVESHQIMAEVTRDARRDLPTKAPCSGAGCGQAPEGTMTVLSTTDRNRDTQVHPDLPMAGIVTPLTSCRRWPTSDADAVRVYGVDLFRPPRLV